MCKLAYIKTVDGTAYDRAIKMIRYQENFVAGHSTGLTFRTSQGFSTRKAIGKVNSFLVKYPDQPSSDEVLGHSRYATVGKINEDNQMPVSIMFRDRKIGYGIHNGTFSDYRSYEHYRRKSMANKTDSALMFTIYSRVLEQLGDSSENRRKAFAWIRKLVGKSQNLIIMFKDGQILFGGATLTYNYSSDKVGIMTFGLPNDVDDGYVYQVKKFMVDRFEIEAPSGIKITRKIPKVPKETWKGWEGFK